MGAAATVNNVDIGTFLQVLPGRPFFQPDSTGSVAGGRLAGDLSLLPLKKDLLVDSLPNSKQDYEESTHSVLCQSIVFGYPSGDL